MMAEDLKRRLHFGDRGLCLGAAGKLYSQVVAQKEKIAISTIGSHSPQIVELKILWEQCTVESYSVSVACCETLVALVRNGHAEFSYVVKGLVNVIPSAINPTGALEALRHLLLLEIHACITTEKIYRCPYGLRHPPHPFISALTSRPDCWPLILQQVSKLLHVTDDRYSCHIVPMLRPFLAYVMLNPTIPQQLSAFKILLSDTVLQAGSNTDTDDRSSGEQTVAVDICNFFLDYLHQVKITSVQELSEVCSQLISVARFVTTNKGTDKTMLKSLSVVCLTLCKECVTFGHDMTSCIKVMDKMIESCGVDANETLICILSWLMLEAPIDQLKGLLSLTQKVVNICEHEAQTCMSECSIKMLIYPLLRIISTPVNDVTVETQDRLATQKGASQLLSDVTRLCEQAHKTGQKFQSKDKKSSQPCLSAWYQMMQSCCQIVNALMVDPSMAYEWLMSLQSNVSSVDNVTSPVMLMVSSLLWGKQHKVVQATLSVLISIATQDNSWAPTLLPLLLYRLGQEGDPWLVLELLCTIPLTAIHKVCVTGVVKVLQSLAEGDGALRPLVLRLTTQLWKLQDRSFAHLQGLLSQPVTSTVGCDEEVNEILLAKVASIKDVCVSRPYHGTDLLPMLSKVLNDCTSEREASLAALALDALYSLCQAEVVDLRTMWAVLAPKLTKEKRPVVIQSLCKLLGSVPALLSETPDYEEFSDSVLELLWQHSNHGNPIVSAAAFTALANFSQEDFTLDDIPPEICKEERAKIASAKAKLKEGGDNAGKKSREEEEEEEYEAVPPACYMKLLMHINQHVLPAYQVFLSSLLIEEVKDLPRGIYKSAIQGQQQEPASKNRTLDNIPSLLLNRFERTKQPGLQPGLSVGLLCCFEPKREVSHRDDKPAKRHIVNKGRAYQHVINTLMNEVCAESSNWFWCIQLPLAWKSLVHNAFHALIQSRCAELELQRSHGHLDDSHADFQAKLNKAWLWTRDKLTDQFKTAAKGTSLAQCNSVLALASLAVVSTQHYLSLDDEDETGPHQQHSSMQHAGQNHWLAVVTDTLLCLLNAKYQTEGKIFTWYQQHSDDLGKEALSASLQSNAALGISLLAPFLLTTNIQKLHHVMDELTNGLPGQPKVHQSHAVQMYYGISLGMLTARLYDEHYTDYTGNEGEVRMIRLVDALEAASLTSSVTSASCGALLGLAMALSAMSTEGAAHIKAHMAAMHQKLVTRLDEEECRDTSYVEALCMCIGCLTAAGFHANIITPDDAFSVAVKLQTICQQHDQNVGLAVCAGVMFHSLVSSSHPSINPLLTNLFSTWSSITTDQTAAVPQRIAALHGLTGLVTGTTLLMPSASHSQITTDMHNKRLAVAKQLSQMLSDWSDLAIQNAVASLLGYLHLVTTSVSQIKTGIPSSYSYLAETSILRACIDQLVLASKSGPEMIPASRLETLLSALAGKQGALPPLPPLNWTAVLSPILRLPYGEKVHCLCLELAISQCRYQPSAALCVTAWLSPALFTTLKEPCKVVLYGSLASLIRAVPASRLQPFTQTNLLEPFRVCGMHTLSQCEVIVESLLAALKIPDPPQGIVAILHKAVKDVYGLMPASLQTAHGRIMAILAQCLCHLQGEDIDAITSPLAQSNLMKSTFVRSYIVCQGRQSLMWLNPCVDVAMNVANSSQQVELIWTLLVALRQCNSVPSQHTGPMPRIHWLLELMGHATNVAHSKTQLAPNRPIYKAVEFLLDVFAAAVIAWSSTNLPLILGIAPSWLTKEHQLGPSDVDVNASFHHSNRLIEGVLQFLPHSLPVLLSKEPWSQITDKVVNWLLGMHDIEHEILSSKTKTLLKASILSLRHTAAFKRPGCWTRVHSL